MDHHCHCHFFFFIITVFFFVEEEEIIIAVLSTLVSDPRKGCYMGLSAFIFFFPPPRFCPGHISETVTRRDSKLSVLLGPAV